MKKKTTKKKPLTLALVDARIRALNLRVESMEQGRGAILQQMMDWREGAAQMRRQVDELERKSLGIKGNETPAELLAKKRGVVITENHTGGGTIAELANYNRRSKNANSTPFQGSVKVQIPRATVIAASACYPLLMDLLGNLGIEVTE